MPNIALTPPRVPFLDPSTGLISREWYKFFFDLCNKVSQVEYLLLNQPTTDMTLAGLSDVWISGAVGAQFLKYDGTSKRWRNV